MSRVGEAAKRLREANAAVDVAEAAVTRARKSFDRARTRLLAAEGEQENASIEFNDFVYQDLVDAPGEQ